MRALYYPNLTELSHSESFTVEGDSFHHLSRVLRVKPGENLLLLNGEGLKGEALIEAIDKKSLKILIQKTRSEAPRRCIDLVLGVPKRDALEDILRSAVEMGVRNVYLWHSKYSQRYDINLERLHKILVSALEQSNNAHLTKVHQLGEQIDLDPILASYAWAAMFTPGSAPESTDSLVGDGLYIIGPEGGFDTAEENWFKQRPMVRSFALPVPILRAPTAVCVALGYLLGRT